MSIMMYMLRNSNPSMYYPLRSVAVEVIRSSSSEQPPKGEPSARMLEFKRKLRETTPISELDQEIENPNQETPLPSFPNNTNPETGEIGGPRGLEPTRYGDWERRGRVVDF